MSQLQLTRSARLAAVSAVVVAMTAALAVGALASGKRPPISPASAFILPSTKSCVSGHRLTFRMRKLRHVTWRTVTVYVNGRHVETVRLSPHLRPITLRGLPSRSFALRLTARTTDRRSVTAKRRYHPCSVAKQQHVLTVSVAGSGSGTVTGSGIACPGTCSHSYTAGSTITLTASAASASSFSGWSGGGCSGTGTCTVTLSSDRTVTATFTAMHTLTVARAGTGSGTVTGTGISCPSTCSHSYTAGSTVTLTASPASGSSFGGWSGGGCSGTGTCQVTLNSNTTVSATFNLQQQHTLTVSKSGGGSGGVSSSPAGIDCGSTCQHAFDAGTQVTLTATAGPGSTFAGWSGGGCSGTGTCQVTLNSNTTITASFDSQQNVLTVIKSGSGSVTSNPAGIDCGGTCSANYGPGTIVLLYATAAPGSTFTGWTGAGCQGTAFCVVYMAGAQSVTATFQAVSPSTLTAHTWGSGSGSVSSDTGGIACPGTCTASYAYGTQVTLTAAAASGSTFVGWSGGGCKGTGTCVMTVDSAQDVTATFEKDPVAFETPGEYSGSTNGNNSKDVHFYVSPGGGSIEDVSMYSTYTEPSCTPSGGTSLLGAVPVGIPAIPIASGGSFSSTTTQAGLVANQPATFTYTFGGQFTSSTAITGTWQEDVTYTDNGTDYSCTTGVESYTASWIAGQTGQNVATASPGNYSGSTEFDNSSDVHFYVSPDGGSIEDVSMYSTYTEPSCTPSGGTSLGAVPVGIASIPINSDGSFAVTSTQTGLINNQPATFTYTFAGHFHGPSSGLARVNGIWREDVTYANNGTSYSCTTNNESFAATLDSGQTGQNLATASPGNYSGSTEFNNSSDFTFAVSSDSSTIENVSRPSTSLPCSPVQPNVSSNVTIASIPIASDGSFTYHESQTGMVAGQPATITYTFNGHVHGRNGSGQTRINGIWREDVTYADNGSAYYCTSNDMSYAAHWTSS